MRVMLAAEMPARGELALGALTGVEQHNLTVPAQHGAVMRASAGGHL